MNLVAPRPKRRNETRDLTKPIMAAVNRLPGVRVWRPHVLSTREQAVTGAGLANGSADLIGLVTVRAPITYETITDETGPHGLLTIPITGRFFTLEVKWPGEYPEPDQRRWMQCVRELGGFATIVHSIAEAIAAVGRARQGAHE